MTQRAEIAGGVEDPRQHLVGDLEDLEQHGIPRRRPELSPRCRRGVSRKAGAEAVAQERIDGPHPQRPASKRTLYAGVVLEQPGELAGREVGIERESALALDLLATAVALEPVQHLLRALVLPGHDRRKWAA